MNYQGHEITIVREVGFNAIIKRKDGGQFETCSFLRHHRGKKVLTDQLMIAQTSIEDYPTFHETVESHVARMTSPTAKFELPDGPGVQRCPHGKEIMKGRPVRCMECYSMDC